MPGKTMTKKLPCGRPLAAPPTPVAGHWEQALAAYSETKGLRHSAPRQTIARIVMRVSGHFKAQDVVSKVQAKDASIGPATVYRTLALLHDAALLKETLVDDDGTTIYEVADSQHHDHIVCLDCGQILEFQDTRIESIQLAVNTKMKFREVRHRHVIYAHCEFQT